MAMSPRKWKHPRGWGWPKWRGWRFPMDNMLIHQGEMLPRGYGVAWREFDRDCSVVMPVPINIIAGWLRRGWHRLRFGYVKDSIRDAMVRRSYDRGYERGSEASEWALQSAYDRGRRDTLQGLHEVRNELRELREEIGE